MIQDVVFHETHWVLRQLSCALARCFKNVTEVGTREEYAVWLDHALGSFCTASIHAQQEDNKKDIVKAWASPARPLRSVGQPVSARG